MTTQEVDELIKQEIYENNVGHITGTVLSSVLQAINNKRLTSYEIFGSTLSENQDFISAFAGVLDTTTIGRGYLDAQSSLQSALVRRLTSDIMFDFVSSDNAGATHELVAAIMNRIGYEFSPYNPTYNMFQSAIASAVAHIINNPNYSYSSSYQDSYNQVAIVDGIARALARIGWDYRGNMYREFVGNPGTISSSVSSEKSSKPSFFEQIILASAVCNLNDGRLCNGFEPYDWSKNDSSGISLINLVTHHDLTSAVMNDMGYQYESNTSDRYNMFRSAILSALIDRQTIDGDNNGYRYLADNLQSSLIGDQLFVSGIFLSMLHNHDVSYEYRNLMCDFALGIFNSAINYNRLDSTTLRNLASAIKSYLY